MLEPTCFYKFTKFCQILILTLWFLTLPCFLAKIAQILQKVVVFFLERGDEIEPWFWHILITQWLTAYIFRFWPSSGETFGQSWTKSANFGSVSFLLIFQFIFNQCFLLEHHLWSFFLLRLLCISINLPYAHVWNTVVTSGWCPQLLPGTVRQTTKTDMQDCWSFTCCFSWTLGSSLKCGHVKSSLLLWLW